MEVANTPAYYDTAAVTAVKRIIVQALRKTYQKHTRGNFHKTF